MDDSRRREYEEILKRSAPPQGALDELLGTADYAAMMGAVLRWPEDQLRLLLIQSVDRLKGATTEPSAYDSWRNV